MTAGISCTAYSLQNGHCGSANSTIVTGASGLPSVTPCCGIPPMRAVVAPPRGAPADERRVVGDAGDRATSRGALLGAAGGDGDRDDDDEQRGAEQAAE